MHTFDRVYEIQASLKSIHSNLTEDFVRSHRSYIINKNHILEIKFLNQSCCEVIYSENKKALLKKMTFNKLFLERMK
ncbi:LytTR family DNA-binding domain-containing protein [Bacillus methanolicus]|uniref:LytTR family DNA-binding domain-containing protein n=1 Tax=Bacillus methanolicus TaxID=1471 RepID=UPI0009D97F9C|nr:LytTR family transcriptional regulator [Bacillus methanolicus]